MARDFVKKLLKSPGSAEFGGVFSGDWQDPKQRVRDLGDGQYRVTGWVDSQNSFGAKVRLHFAVVLHYDGNDTWTAVAGPLLSELGVPQLPGPAPAPGSSPTAATGPSVPRPKSTAARPPTDTRPTGEANQPRDLETRLRNPEPTRRPEPDSPPAAPVPAP